MPVTGFGDGMLDLDAGVDFQEIEILLLVDEEFDGAGVGVAGGFDQPHGGFAQLFADVLAEARGWAIPRPASDAGAASSNRVPRGGRRCRGCRPGSALRRAGRIRRIFRCRRWNP